MDFSPLNDVPISDPFLSLETELNDVSDVISHGWRDPLLQQPEASSSTTSHFSWNIEDRLFQSLPDQERSLEIGNIATFLQEEASYFLPTEPEQPMDIQASPALPPPQSAPFNAVQTQQLLSAPSLMEIQCSPVTRTQPQPQDPRIPTFGNNAPPAVSCGGQMFPQSASSPIRTSAKEDLLRLLTKLSSKEVENLMDDAKDERTKQTPSTAPGRAIKAEARVAPQTGVATKIPQPGKASDSRAKGQRQARAMPSPVLRAVPSPMSDDSDIEEGSSQRGQIDTKPFKNLNKTERRTAHNLIEKKYRCSINDRINELRAMMAGEESKLSKSATLKKAIDYIQYLQGTNEDLRQKVQELKNALVLRGGSVSPTPECAAVSSPSESVSSSVDDISDSVGSQRAKRGRTDGGSKMLDRSRVTLFVFMMCLVLFNPFQLMLAAGGGSAVESPAHVKGPGRTLQSAGIFDNAEPDSSWWHDKMFRMMCMWLVNGIVIACILARLLIYGEPVADFESYSWAQFSRHKAQAENEVSKGNLSEGARELVDCLRLLGRPLPVGVVDQWAAFVWQLCRQLLNYVWVGQWMSRQRRGGVKPQSVTRSHAEAALVYHRLHQFHMLGLVPGGSLSGLTMALSAVNLAESADSSFPSLLLAELYVTAALRFKTSFAPSVGIGKLFENYFLSRARKTTAKSGSQLPPNFAWIFHPVGQRFWNSKQRELETALSGPKASAGFPFCSVKNSASPLEHLTASFKLYLLRKLLDTVLSARRRSGHWYEVGRRDKTLNGRYVVDIMDWSHLLLEISRPYDALSLTVQNPSVLSLAAADRGDELCVWWTQLLTGAVHWATDDFVLAQKKYQLVRAVPKDLLSEPLSLALGHAFCARKQCLENKDNKQYEKWVWTHCCKSRQAMKQVRLQLKSGSELSNASTLVHLLVYDWLLSSLVDVWQERLVAGNQYWTQPACANLLQLFQQVLVDFRNAAQSADWLQSKILLYEAAARMLSGANPVGTWQLLSRCARLQRSDQHLVESDRARLLHLLQLHDVIGRV